MNNEKKTNKTEQAMPEKIVGQRDVFISYKRQNASFVTRLYDELERHGISAWVDLSKLYKEAGEEYQEKICKAIESARYFLLIYTDHEGCSIEESDYIIENELKYAVEKKKTILFYPQDPVDLNTSRVKPYVEKIQWLDTVETARYQMDTQESLTDENKLKELSALINKKDGFSIFDDQNVFLIRVALQRILNKITVFGNYTKLCGTGNNEFYNNQTFLLRVINKALYYDAPEEYKEQLEKLGFYRKDKVQEVERHVKSIMPDEEELKNQLYNFIAKYYKLEDIYNRLQQYISVEKYKSIILPQMEKFDTTAVIDTIRKMVACSFIDDLKNGKTMFNGAELGVYNIKDNRTTNSEHPLSEIDLYYSDYFTFKCMTEMYHVLCSIEDKNLKIEKVGDVHPLAPFLCSLGLGGFLAVYTEKGISLMWTKRSGNISSGDMWHFSYDETVSLLLDAAKKDGKILVDKDKTVHIDINQLLSRALKEEVGATPELVEQENHGLFEVGIIKSERLEIELISQAVLHLPKEQSLEGKIKSMHDSANDGYLEISKIEFLPLRDRSKLIGRLLSPESYSIFERMQSRLVDCAGKKVTIGDGVLIEEGSYIGDNSVIGDNCRIHRNVFIDKNVSIGNLVKIQNNNSIYEGVTLEDGVFVGTNVTFINDRHPRATLRNGNQVGRGDWEMGYTRVCYGASIGAGAVILCGKDKKELRIGKFAMVAAGSVVLEDVPDFAMVAGNPAKIIRTNIDY